MPPTSMLSPLACPFEPEHFEIMIYNDGVPSMTAVGALGEHDILQGISDEALDEQFPPTAQEAAEMEAAEVFVEMMVRFSIMEDMEESARNNFDHLQKRWEARREEGLLGKPSLPREALPGMDIPKKNNHLNSHTTEDRIVAIEHSHNILAAADLESRIRAKQEKKLNRHQHHPKNQESLNMKRRVTLLRQPRKHN